MTLFFFFLGILQCAALWLLGQAGARLQEKAAKERELAKIPPPGGWPPCAMIIPMSGLGASSEAALRSLLEQDYGDFSVIVVTASEDDPATRLIRLLREEYPRLRHVVAGLSENRGQKNHNLLAGVASAGDACDIYVFCDSTHIARPDFLRCLAGPIARGQCAFSTGYHEVDPEDNGAVTLAYALSVLAMRFLQAMAVFTQPWGGAMAMRRDAFQTFHVPELWAENVVDDCSLAWLLQKEGAHAQLCAGALLLTPVRDHSLGLWRAWLKRQILFLKFCLPGQWLALGLFSLAMILPPIWCLVAVLGGILDIGGNAAPFLALCWACLAAWAIDRWRRFIPRQTHQGYWLWAFFCACAMFFMVYIGTLSARVISWRNISYKVGERGRVERIIRQ